MLVLLTTKIYFTNNIYNCYQVWQKLGYVQRVLVGKIIMEKHEYLLLKIHGTEDTGIVVLPFQILVNLGLQPAVLRVPVIGQLQLPAQIAHDRHAARHESYHWNSSLNIKEHLTDLYRALVAHFNVKSRKHNKISFISKLIISYIVDSRKFGGDRSYRGRTYRSLL